MLGRCARVSAPLKQVHISCAFCWKLHSTLHRRVISQELIVENALLAVLGKCMMSCGGDSYGYQLVCSVQRRLFFPLKRLSFMSRKGTPPPVLSNGMSKLQSRMKTGNVLCEVLEVFPSTISGDAI